MENAKRLTAAEILAPLKNPALSHSRSFEFPSIPLFPQSMRRARERERQGLNSPHPKTINNISSTAVVNSVIKDSLLVKPGLNQVNPELNQVKPGIRTEGSELIPKADQQIINLPDASIQRGLDDQVEVYPTPAQTHTQVPTSTVPSSQQSISLEAATVL